MSIKPQLEDEGLQDRTIQFHTIFIAISPIHKINQKIVGFRFGLSITE
jgi:hypothetical protein